MTTRRKFVRNLAYLGPAAASIGVAPTATAQSASTGLPGSQGVLFGVDGDGKLRWLMDESRDGTIKWHPNTDSIIGSGWGGFRQLIAAENGVIFALGTDGSLRWYQYTGNNGEWQWHANSGSVIGSGWSSLTLVYGGGGVLYAINGGTGALQWYHYLGSDGAYQWHSLSGSVIGTGWSPRLAAGNAQGTLFYVDASNNLRWYKDLNRNGAKSWAAGSGSIIGAGWAFSQLIGARDDILYGLHSDGTLRWYRHSSDTPTFAWDTRSDAAIRSGVTYRLLTAACTQAILGYSNPEQSVEAGGSLPLYLSTSARTYNLEVYRLGTGNSWPGVYGTKQPALSVANAAATLRSIPEQSWQVGCGWPQSQSLVIPSSWASGVYAVHCIDSNGSKFWIPFAVRPPQSRARSRFAVLLNTNTWNAYNSWGGRSNYTKPNGVRLTMQRPNPAATPLDRHAPRAAIATPAGSQELHLLISELWGHKWLLDNGYAYDVYSDMDLHEGRLNLAEYKSLILLAHPEYWTVTMYEKLRSFLALAGRSLFYLGGNGIYESMDYSTDRQAMIMRGGSETKKREEVTFESIGMPQHALLGVGYRYTEANLYAAYAVVQSQHRFFAGTSLVNGSSFGQVGLGGAASGHELDFTKVSKPPPAPEHSPAGVEVLSRGMNRVAPSLVDAGAEMVTYRAPGGGIVFSAGSLSFTGALSVDATLSRIVRNALAEG